VTTPSPPLFFLHRPLLLARLLTLLALLFTRRHLNMSQNLFQSLRVLLLGLTIALVHRHNPRQNQINCAFRLAQPVASTIWRLFQRALVSAAALARREKVESVFSIEFTEKARTRKGTEMAIEIGTRIG
jgi:hypothetical protein